MNFHLPDAIAVLSRTPATLDALLRGLPPSWTNVDEGPGTFAPWDVVGHLIHGERTDWIPRARWILEKGDAEPFAPFDREGHRAMFFGAALDGLLDTFRVERAANLDALRALRLTTADLDRRGLHPALGPVTMRMLLATWVVHDLGHVRQIVRAMAGAYRGEVGRWSEYLPVLSERGG